ncbi:response regulator transcription factor [bacterium]|nr:response regulator transcription factor [bacterium]
MRILVVEDELKLAQALRQGLEREGYEVTVAATGEEGYFLATTARYELIVLDLMLPGRDGLEVLAALRERGQHLPVLILTARDTVEDRVRGLDGGADDYLVKPFAFAELLARIRALTRRGPATDTQHLQIADLVLDRVKRQVMRDGTPVALTAKEFQLLEYLLLNRGQVVTREMLAHDVWDGVACSGPLDNVIDVHLARLRQKIDIADEPSLIRTIRGVGFMIAEDTP